MEDAEETRKIQYTGKSSYIVSLPKKWVADLGLQKGDQLRMQRNGSSGLHVYPARNQASPRRKEEAAIAIRDGEATEAVVRKLVSLYFLGFKSITVRPASGRISPQQRTAVKGAVKRMLMGAEIISDSTAGITVQVLVNLLELSVDGAFKRMIHLSKSMLGDAILAASEGNAELAGEVISTDDEVDRFGFYITRQINIAMENEHMLPEMGLRGPRSCLGYMAAVKSIERAGDHAALIARDVLEFERPLKSTAAGRISDMNSFAVGALDDACLALFKEDHAQAEATIARAGEISRHEKRVLDACRSMSDEEAFRARRAAANVRRIAEYASDIAEAVLNMNIEKAVLRKR